MTKEQFKRAEELYKKIATAERILKNFDESFINSNASGSIAIRDCDKFIIAEYSANFSAEWFVEFKKQFKQFLENIIKSATQELENI